MPPGRFVDAMPLLLLTTASLRAGSTFHGAGDWDVRRFRPNLFIDTELEGWVEDGWCGWAVVSATSSCCHGCPVRARRRYPRAARARADLDIYRTVARKHDGNLGVWTTVETSGTVRVGDPIEIVDVNPTEEER